VAAHESIDSRQQFAGFRDDALRLEYIAETVTLLREVSSGEERRIVERRRLLAPG
jgi:hypothetical protein